MPYLHDLAKFIIDPSSRKKTCPIYCVPPSADLADLEDLTQTQKAWLKTSEWRPDLGTFALIPDEKGGLAAVVLVCQSASTDSLAALTLGRLPALLPQGIYHIEGDYGDEALAVISWLLGAYAFQNYKAKRNEKQISLKLPKNVDKDYITAQAEAVWFGRDLINIPANDMGPEELESAARLLAKKHKAKIKVIAGDKLLKENFPLIHTVGRASSRPPRLIDMQWGTQNHPLITLIGKGICYDTGGLNLKPGNYMSLMKKDMGGAATVLALAHMIMSEKLPIRLKVLIPAAENSVSGNAFRPGDILPSRNGMTVEIGNTDAEGRLVLADALTFAAENQPDHLMTFATLTGAARVALGPDLPAFYCTDKSFADAVIKSSLKVSDPLWQMPFWQPYDDMLKSKVAQVNHISSGGFAGSITAALFLKRFVKTGPIYSHFDIYGWVPSTKPGKPFGGEPQAARAVFEVLAKTYPK